MGPLAILPHVERNHERRDPRLPLTLEVRVKPLASSPSGSAEAKDGPPAEAAPADASTRRGHTRNVAAGGAFVELDDDGSLAVGAPILLEIDAPSLHEPVEVRGEVRWVRPSAETAGGFGVRFIEADRRASAALSALLEAKNLVEGPAEPEDSDDEGGAP